MEGSTSTGGVRIVSRRLVRPHPAAASSPADNNSAPSSEPETMHLTPWDLRLITEDQIQKGLLLPKPPTAGAQLVDSLASSLARALARFYPLAGRLAVEDAAATATGGGPTPGVVVSLRCTGEGAELVHAVAPDVTVSDVVIPGGGYYVPSSLVWSLFPLNGLLSADAALDQEVPVLAAQVTELADGVFVAVSLNHAVADGFTFWHLFNTWSEISRRMMTASDGFRDGELSLSTPPPVLDRWFLDTSPVPIPLPFTKLDDIVRRPVYPTVRECFFHFSASSVKNLKAKANAEIAGTATVSSLLSLLAHLWRATCRARELPPDRETAYTVFVGCRGRLKSIPQTYVGNTVTYAVARSTAGELLRNGLGWAAWVMNRAVASVDEHGVREDLASWPRDPVFFYVAQPHEEEGPAKVQTGSSPRFDVYGNDFGWGRPLAVRSGAGNKVDGKVTVYEGRGGGGSMALEVCLAPEALARLVADEEFMEAVSAATA